MIQSISYRNVKRCLSQNSTLIICRYSHSKKTHYDTLNLKSNCTNDEIRHAFAKLSKEHHPDTSRATNTENSSRKFQEIMEAYRVLNKKTSRDAYDAEIFNRPEPRRSHTINYYHTYGGADYEMIRRHRAAEYYRNDPYGHPYGHYGPPFDRRYGQQDPFNDWNDKQYDAWKSNPLNALNRKRVFSFLIGFGILNFMSILFMYSLTSRNRAAMNDFKDAHGRTKIGAHGPTYGRSIYFRRYHAEDDPVVK